MGLEPFHGPVGSNSIVTTSPICDGFDFPTAPGQRHRPALPNPRSSGNRCWSRRNHRRSGLLDLPHPRLTRSSKTPDRQHANGRGLHRQCFSLVPRKPGRVLSPWGRRGLLERCGATGVWRGVGFNGIDSDIGQGFTRRNCHVARDGLLRWKSGGLNGHQVLLLPYQVKRDSDREKEKEEHPRL